MASLALENADRSKKQWAAEEPSLEENFAQLHLIETQRPWPHFELFKGSTKKECWSRRK